MIKISNHIADEIEDMLENYLELDPEDQIEPGDDAEFNTALLRIKSEFSKARRTSAETKLPYMVLIEVAP